MVVGEGVVGDFDGGTGVGNGDGPFVGDLVGMGVGDRVVGLFDGAGNGCLGQRHN